jgi:hypothetical protein
LGSSGYDFKSSLRFVSDRVNGEYFYDEKIMGGVLDEADSAFGYMDWVLQQDINKDIVEAMKSTRIRFLRT